MPGGGQDARTSLGAGAQPCPFCRGHLPGRLVETTRHSFFLPGSTMLRNLRVESSRVRFKPTRLSLSFAALVIYCHNSRVQFLRDLIERERASQS